MAARTRLALVTVIILVGCVFAIPHFRHPTGDTAKSDSTTADEDITDLTLKVTSNDKKPAAKKPEPIALREVDSLKQPSVLIQPPVAPPTTVKEEEWKFPPISQFGESKFAASQKFAPPSRTATKMRSLEPVPANSGSTDTRQIALKPIRLLGDKIGKQMNSTTRNQSDGRQTTTERFRSNTRSTTQTLVPKPLPAQDRFAAQQSKSQSLEPKEDDADWHRVVNGDTLEKLSQQYYGSPQKALVIFEANRQALFNPAILPIGLDLKIPKQDVRRPTGQATANQMTTTGLRPLKPQPVRPVSLP